MKAKSMMNAGLLMLILVLVETAAFAAQGVHGKAEATVPIESMITISIENLDCSTSVGKGMFAAMSYAFGAQRPTDLPTEMSAGGAIVQPAIVQPLQLTRKLDDCSAALFGGVVENKPLGDFELNYEMVDQAGKRDPLLKITMMGVSISSYSIAGTAEKSALASPQESVQIDYAKICIEVIDKTKSLPQICYDRSPQQ